MQLKWRNCEEVEREHQKDIRQYAHTYHYPGVICVCAAFWELPKKYRDGILLHEIGHLIVGPRGSEAEATAAAEAFFGAEIRYVDSAYGRELERLSNMARARLRRNPGPDDLPYGEWIPTHAVKFNHDGTVSLMAEPAANRGRRNPFGASQFSGHGKRQLAYSKDLFKSASLRGDMRRVPKGTPITILRRDKASGRLFVQADDYGLDSYGWIWPEDVEE